MTTEHYNIVIRSLSFNVPPMPPRKRAYARVLVCTCVRVCMHVYMIKTDQKGKKIKNKIKRLFNYEYALLCLPASIREKLEDFCRFTFSVRVDIIYVYTRHRHLNVYYYTYRPISIQNQQALPIMGKNIF